MTITISTFLNPYFIIGTILLIGLLVIAYFFIRKKLAILKICKSFEARIFDTPVMIIGNQGELVKLFSMYSNKKLAISPIPIEGASKNIILDNKKEKDHISPKSINKIREAVKEFEGPVYFEGINKVIDSVGIQKVKKLLDEFDEFDIRIIFYVDKGDISEENLEILKNSIKIFDDPKIRFDCVSNMNKQFFLNRAIDMQKEMIENDENSESKNHAKKNLAELIKKKIDAGYDEKQIIKDMKDEGWADNTIRASFEELKNHETETLQRLNNYILKMHDKGVSNKVIIQKLLDAGWKEEDIDKALSEE